MKALFRGFVISLSLAVSGCLAGGGDSAPSVASSTQGVSLTNSLSFNQLTNNRLTVNRLTVNRLTVNRLTVNRLEFNSIDGDGLETTPEGRELLLYVTRCALEDGLILVAEHDGVEYEFPGLLGLTPEWEFRPLFDHEVRLMSACLLTHVNAYGVSVPISLRIPELLEVEGSEAFDFPVYEGTFFGNVFGEDLEAYGCIGDNPDVAIANSPDRVLRVCTDPSPDCEVVSLGRCRDVCETRTLGYGWQGCWANGFRYDETIAVYLHDPNEDGNNQTCTDDSCKLKINSAGSGILNCSESGSCRSVCQQGSTCMLEGTGALSFTAEVKQDSLAEVNCHETNECNATCKSGSVCEIDCKDANECQSKIRCEDGAECLLDCTGAVECGFDQCEGNLQSCEGDIMVCNRACPASA
jgi:hypothetical protein